MKRRQQGCSFAAGVLLAGPALAVGLSDISANLPLTIEDVTPIEPGGWEAEGAVVYERQSRRQELLTLQPRLKYGAAQHLELSLTLPYSVGTGEEADSGALELETLYLLLQETGVLPTISTGARLGQGFGDAAGDTSGAISLLASKRLKLSERAPVWHLNLGWEHVFDSAADEKRNRRLLALGVSQVLGPRWAVLADLVWEDLPQQGEAATLLEAGARYQLSKEAVISAGLGIGLDSESPDLRLAFGWQQSF